MSKQISPGFWWGSPDAKKERRYEFVDMRRRIEVMNEPKQVIVLPKGLKRTQLQELRDAGFIPIVTDTPESVRIISPERLIDGDEMLWAALQAMNDGVSTSEQAKFTQLVTQIIKRKLDKSPADEMP